MYLPNYLSVNKLIFNSLNRNIFESTQVWDLLIASNNSLKPTETCVTHFAEMAKPAPRYGGLVPPFYGV